MPSFCERCAKDRHLRALIDERGKTIEKCDVCDSTNVKALDCDDRTLKSLVRALVRYYYSEWKYNTHLGGDEIEQLMRQDNPIIAYDANWQQDEYDDNLSSFFGNGYEEYDQGITLYSGFSDGIRNPPLVALKDTADANLRKLQSRLLEVNSFLLEADAQLLLSPHIGRLEQSFLRERCFIVQG